jgi:hypothetical protein
MARNFDMHTLSLNSHYGRSKNTATALDGRAATVAKAELTINGGLSGEGRFLNPVAATQQQRRRTQRAILTAAPHW